MSDCPLPEHAEHMKGIAFPLVAGQTIDRASMDSFELTTHSFIVKIWLEELPQKETRGTWRGHITHIPDRQRRYVSSLDEINDFISLYLDEIGIRREVSHGLKRWLRLWKPKPAK